MGGVLTLAKTGITRLSHAELLQLFRARLGLILGPAAVHGTGIFDTVSQTLATSLEVPKGKTYLETADHALASGRPDHDVRRVIRELVNGLGLHPNISRLADVRWSAVLSASLSDAFEERFRQATDRDPVGHVVTVYEDASRALPPRTVPVFKLLGGVLRDGCAISTVTYMRRRSLWGPALKQFSDQTQGGPVLCIGMSDCAWLLFDLLAAMTALPMSTPRALLFAATDPLLEHPDIVRALQGHSSLVAVDAPEGGILAAAAAAGVRPPAPAFPSSSTLARRIGDFADFAILVNDQLEVSSNVQEERQRLSDLLFSPGRPSWEPFIHDLDLRRTVADTILTDIKKQLAAGGESAACVVFGPAASGKTTLLKRVALEVARQGVAALWLRPWLYQDSRKVLAALMTAVAGTLKHDGSLVAFLDDPASLGSITPKDVLSAATAAGLRAIVVVGLRTSDWALMDHDEPFGSWEVSSTHGIPDSLDDRELALLPKVLVALGIYSTFPEAQRQIANVPSRKTKDTLSVLYWLLPSTREAISHSIKDEYFRLGDGAGLAQVIIGSYRASSQVLQDAYAMAAVGDRYQAPLPLEVVVSALGVSYSDWIDATAERGPAWGLLYPTGGPDETTTYYSTRNSVVTNVLIEAINGGALGHSGELRILSRLLEGCTGTQGIYREFAVRILVPSKRFQNRLGFHEALSLYEAAERALPLPDRTLLHHKALWIKNVGKDPATATRVLEQALQATPFPYSDREEASEHIHTSLAATALDALEMGQLSMEEGRDRVLAELAQARSSHFFNPRAAHVEAKLIIRLRRHLGRDQVPDQLAMTSSAVANVDRTLLLLSSQGLKGTKDYAKDVEVLTNVREELLSSDLPSDDLEKYADELWEQNGRQDGFVIMGRRLYGAARETKRGGDYNAAFSYVRTRLDRVAQRKEPASPHLVEVALHIYYAWMIHRSPGASALAERLDWKWVLGAVESVMQAADIGRSPFYSYLRALALCHLENWGAGQSIFSELRREGVADLWIPRDFLLAEDGRPRQVQGEIRAGGEKHLYLYVSDLHQDFIARKGDRWPRPGEIVHAYITFSFAGPAATSRS